MTNIDPIQQHHIENYGLNSAGGSIGNRPESAQRAKDYEAHCQRLLVDEDYAEECRIKELEYQKYLNHNRK